MFIPENPFSKKTTQPLEQSFTTDDVVGAYPTSHKNNISQETDECSHEVPTCTDGAVDEPRHVVVGPKMSHTNSWKKKG